MKTAKRIRAKGRREPVSTRLHSELGQIRDELTTIANVSQLLVLALGHPGTCILKCPTETDSVRALPTLLERYVVDALHAQIAQIRTIRREGV
jgi:hypothetical protein